MRRILTRFLLASAAFALPTAAFADAHMDQGFAAVEEFDYARALGEFRIAAEEGNVQGARIAGFMLLYGEGLYGPAVKQDRAAAVRLLKKAADGGCAVSAAVLPKIVADGEAPVAMAANAVWREKE